MQRRGPHGPQQAPRGDRGENPGRVHAPVQREGLRAHHHPGHCGRPGHVQGGHLQSKEDIIDRLNDRYYEGLDWFPDLSKIPGENGLEKLRYAFRHFLTDPAKRKVDRLVIGYVVKNPKITLLTLESTFRDAAPYVEKVLMLLTNVWTGMFAGSREEFARKLRFSAEFLKRFGLPVLDEQLQADALNYYDQVIETL